MVPRLPGHGVIELRQLVVLDGPDPDVLGVVVERGEVEDAVLTCGAHGRVPMKVDRSMRLSL
jgi:hypothetical protein